MAFVVQVTLIWHTPHPLSSLSTHMHTHTHTHTHTHLPCLLPPYSHPPTLHLPYSQHMPASSKDPQHTSKLSNTAPARTKYPPSCVLSKEHSVTPVSHTPRNSPSMGHRRVLMSLGTVPCQVTQVGPAFLEGARHLSTLFVTTHHLETRQ